MSRCCIKVGFSITREAPDQPGVWVDDITVKTYYGDCIRKQYDINNGNGLNGDVTLSNTFSVLADKFAIENYEFAKYVEFKGHKLSIRSVTFEYPRLSITIGGIYNEQTN